MTGYGLSSTWILGQENGLGIGTEGHVALSSIDESVILKVKGNIGEACNTSPVDDKEHDEADGTCLPLQACKALHS